MGGPNRGKYRHPHTAFAAVETWLANKVMPDKCGATWDENNPNYPMTPDTTTAFGKMAVVEGHENDPKQPFLDPTATPQWVWPGDEGDKRKAVPGEFVIELYLTPTTIGEPMPAVSTATSTNGDKSDVTSVTMEESSPTGTSTSSASAVTLAASALLMVGA